MLSTYNFFSSEAPQDFSFGFPFRGVSWSIDMYYSKGWEMKVIEKKTLQKNIEISFFNIGDILLLYLSISNTTYFEILKYLAKAWCEQIILRGTSIDIALSIQWGLGFAASAVLSRDV